MSKSSRGKKAAPEAHSPIENMELSLFPLGMVLNPGQRTSLRIFEQRYLNLVRESTRNNRCFGIISVLQHSAVPVTDPASDAMFSGIESVTLMAAESAPDSALESQDEPQHGLYEVQLAAVGCEARIVDFYTLPDGLLGIEVIGERRFRLQTLSVRDDGLHVGHCEPMVEPNQPVPAEFSLLADLVSAFLQQGANQGQSSVLEAALQASEQTRSAPKPVLPGVWELDDAAWVGYRLSEILPLDLDERQVLLEMDTPNERLQRLLDWLPRFQRDDE